jgi:hypothetical protein
MDTRELEFLISRDKVLKERVVGVVAADLWPKNKLKPGRALISNNKKSSHPGEHWTALMIGDNGKPHFFCSFGNAPEFYQTRWRTYLKRHYGSYRYSKLKIQSGTTSVCGLHALLAILCFYGNKPLSRVYFRCPDVNDTLAITFFNDELKNMSKHPCPLINSCNQKCVSRSFFAKK